MPDLSDRLAREARLDLALQPIFARQERRSLAVGITGDLDWQEFQQSSQREFERHLGETSEAAGALLMLLILGSDTFDPLAAREWAAQAGDVISTELVLNSQEMLREARLKAAEASQKAVKAQQEQAEIDQIRAETLREFAHKIFSSTRTETIAATETTRAISMGEAAARHILATQFGVELMPIWVTEKDDRVCPICRPNHRKEAPAWEAEFPTGPPAHPRCRCYLDYRVIENP